MSRFLFNWSITMILFLWSTIANNVISVKLNYPNGKQSRALCSDEFIYCAETSSCLDIVCIDNLLNNLDICWGSTVYCPVTDECLDNCPNDESSPDPLETFTINTLSPDVSVNFPRDEPSIDSKVNETEQMISIEMNLIVQADYSSTVGNRSKEFYQLIKEQLVGLLSFPNCSIQNLVVFKKPFKVSFNIVLWPETNQTAKQFYTNLTVFQDKLNRNEIFLTDFNNRTIYVTREDNLRQFNGTDEKPATQSRQQKSSSDSKEPSTTESTENNSFLVVLLIIGAGVVILIVIIGIVFAKRMLNHRRQRVSPFVEMRHKDTPSSSEQQSQRERTNLSEFKDANSYDKLDYENSLWMNLESNSDKTTIPEPAVYIPPQEYELQRIPRPATSIRNRLLDKYSIDFGEYSFNYSRN